MSCVKRLASYLGFPHFAVESGKPGYEAMKRLQTTDFLTSHKWYLGNSGTIAFSRVSTHVRVSAHPPFWWSYASRIYASCIQMACLCKRPPPFFGLSISSAHGHLLERIRYSQEKSIFNCRHLSLSLAMFWFLRGHVLYMQHAIVELPEGIPFRVQQPIHCHRRRWGVCSWGL